MGPEPAPRDRPAAGLACSSSQLPIDVGHEADDVNRGRPAGSHRLQLLQGVPASLVEVQDQDLGPVHGPREAQRTGEDDLAVAHGIEDARPGIEVGGGHDQSSGN